MKILIIGGTVFVGRALVNAAQAKGHQVTLFNRGLSNPGLFHHLETIIGDREGNLSELEDRTWDAVIDTCGYVPRIVRKSAEKLVSQVGTYVFISTLSVYADTSQTGISESYPVGQLENEEIEEVNADTYGPLKAYCEQAVRDIYQERALILRPGLIVGPHDPTDRFTYWPVRVAHSQEVLAPGRPERAVQFIDVRDLAEWTIRLLEVNKTGTYNAIGPAEPLSMQKLLETCDQTCSGETNYIWVSEEFLLQEDVEPWKDMPLWMPESEDIYQGFFSFDNRKAMRDGLTFRPLEDTLRDTCRWAEARPSDRIWRAGIDRARQAELLKKWYAEQDL